MRVIDLRQTCGGYPSQWEFRTFENRLVYVRYRWGYLGIYLSGPDGDLESAVNGTEIYGKQYGGDLNGCLTWREIAPIVAALPEKE